MPGLSVNALAWERGGLRIALAVESFVYFANVQPRYHWGYFAGTVVYSFSRPDRPEACVMFWDLQTKETHAKYVKRLVTVKVLINDDPHLAMLCVCMCCQFLCCFRVQQWLRASCRHLALHDYCMSRHQCHICKSEQQPRASALSSAIWLGVALMLLP